MNGLPYVKGTWYRAIITGGSSITIQSIDGPISTSSISGGKLKLPTKFRVVDYKIDIDNSNIASATSITTSISKYADGTLAITLPDSKLFGQAYVYIFGYFN